MRKIWEMGTDRLLGVLRLGILAVLALLLLVAAGAFETIPEENRAAVTAATVAATEEYERVMEMNGCHEMAQFASNRQFEEVMEQWG